MSAGRHLMSMCELTTSTSSIQVLWSELCN